MLSFPATEPLMKANTFDEILAFVAHNARRAVLQASTGSEKLFAI